MRKLAVPDPGFYLAKKFVEKELLDFCIDEVEASPSIRGGQNNANEALLNFETEGYAKNRAFSYPVSGRKTSVLSPYVNSGLIQLKEIWDHTQGSLSSDRSAIQNNILWQEYARHWFARLGDVTNLGTLRELDFHAESTQKDFDLKMGCVELPKNELEENGWINNETRMWLAGMWTQHLGNTWQSGEQYFAKHLLDGSDAANRLGWQRVSGVGSDRPYKFTRWQVEKFAPGLCASCDLANQCPIEQESDDPLYVEVNKSSLLKSDPDIEKTRGPLKAANKDKDPDYVWIHSESMGDNDPASTIYPELPIIFVLNSLELMKLKLSSKRLIFWIENLSELATRRHVEIWLGSPTKILNEKKLATTFIPTPRFTNLKDKLNIVSLAPWPWLIKPTAGDITSFESWKFSCSDDLDNLQSISFDTGMIRRDIKRD